MSITERYSVRPVTSEDCKPWILKRHYAKRMPSISYSFGLFNGNELQGICTIGKPASPFLCVGVCGESYSEYVYELNRLCVIEKLEKNVLSFFVGSCLKQIKDDMILVSYADTEMGHNGYIYQATNWIYTGATKERTDIGFEDGTHSRHYDKEIDKRLNRKNRSSKHRYVFFLGKNKKQFRSNLKYDVFPYPKGENKRYDTSQPIVVQSSFC